MSDDIDAQLVTAATEAIVQSWSPETEYDEAGHVAVVATLRTLAEEADRRGALSVSVTTLRATADRIEQGNGGERP